MNQVDFEGLTIQITGMAKQLEKVTRAFDEFIKVMAETEEFKELINIIAMRGENNDKQKQNK